MSTILEAHQCGQLREPCTFGNHVCVKGCLPDGATNVQRRKDDQGTMVYQGGIQYAVASIYALQACRCNSCPKCLLNINFGTHAASV